LGIGEALVALEQHGGDQRVPGLLRHGGGDAKRRKAHPGERRCE
jgi:hypothetical protein